MNKFFNKTAADPKGTGRFGIGSTLGDFAYALPATIADAALTGGLVNGAANTVGIINASLSEPTEAEKRT